MDTIGGKKAYVLFGGVASGKTTLAETLERQTGKVYSMDRMMWQRAIELREDTREIVPVLRSTERRRLFTDGCTSVNIYDFMPIQRILNVILEVNDSITALHINISRKERLRRFQERRKRQFHLMMRFCQIIGQPERYIHPMWLNILAQDPEIYEGIPDDLRDEYNRVLKELYLSGAHEFDERTPDPLEYDGIDYVAEYRDSDDLTEVTFKQIEETKIPIADILVA